jgi:hypothetical protein
MTILWRGRKPGLVGKSHEEIEKVTGSQDDGFVEGREKPAIGREGVPRG